MCILLGYHPTYSHNPNQYRQLIVAYPLHCQESVIITDLSSLHKFNANYLKIPCQKSCQKYGDLMPGDYNSVM